MKLKHPVVYGHPLHAMLSDLPIAFLPLALLASIAERVRPDRQTRWAADLTAALAASMTAAALGLGWWDWLTVPAAHPAKRPATIHGLLNSANLALVTAAAGLPRRRAALLALANLGLLVAAWIGGDLVYRLGWRVRPAEELELRDAGMTREEALQAIERHEREDLLLTTTR